MTDSLAKPAPACICYTGPVHGLGNPDCPACNRVGECTCKLVSTRSNVATLDPACPKHGHYADLPTAPTEPAARFLAVIRAFIALGMVSEEDAGMIEKGD